MKNEITNLIEKAKKEVVETVKNFDSSVFINDDYDYTEDELEFFQVRDLRNASDYKNWLNPETYDEIKKLDSNAQDSIEDELKEVFSDTYRDVWEIKAKEKLDELKKAQEIPEDGEKVFEYNNFGPNCLGSSDINYVSGTVYYSEEKGIIVSDNRYRDNGKGSLSRIDRIYTYISNPDNEYQEQDKNTLYIDFTNEHWDIEIENEELIKEYFPELIKGDE